MYARRASKFKQAPAVGYQPLFGDVFADQPASTDLVNLTPSINGDGYIIPPDSQNGIGLRVTGTGGFARAQTTGAANEQGNRLVESTGSEWGIGFHAIQEKIDFVSGNASGFHINIPVVRSNFVGSSSALTKNGVSMRAAYLDTSDEYSLRMFSYSAGAQIWNNTAVTLPYTGPIWVRIETEIDGTDTVEIAAAYATTSGLPGPGDWTIIEGPTAGIPIASQNFIGVGHWIRVYDDVLNARLLEIYVDTDRVLGV